jgi:hypothetical protein
VTAWWFLPLVFAAFPGNGGRDSCTAAIPAELRKAVAHQFPSYRLPRDADNLPEDIRYNREHGGGGCLGVTTGDFSGNGRNDFAFLLMSKHDVWLAVAHRDSSAWQVEKVWNAGKPSLRIRLYVDKAPPGKYDDVIHSESDAAPEPGQVESFTSKSDVVVTGTIESTEIAFSKGPKGWIHVWISD